MFCYQCEQTAKGSGCTIKGVCGKEADTAALQDLLVYSIKGVAMYAHRAKALGASDHDLDIFTLEAMFSTLTNVNFDADRLVELIGQAAGYREKAKALYEAACNKAGQSPEQLGGPAAFAIASGREALVSQGQGVGVEASIAKYGDTVAGLRELIVYGIKGLAAYADHAQILGQEDDSIYAYIYEALDYLTQEEQAVDALLGLALKCGEVNLKAMELLDAGNTGTYGHPVPTPVPLGHKAGKAILVSGHDLEDLDNLLKQTEGKGINVYTHGEMLPCHGYPELKKYSHFYGHYGTAWQNQGKEFPQFPGAILMTTNCIQKPKGDTPDKIWTTGVVAWPGVPHITGGGSDKDFSPLINKALEMPGFASDEDKGQVLTGFARNAVLGVADKVIEAVKGGAIKHFFLVGGCDGAKPGRSYYSDFVEQTPSDTIVLTLACGKFRFFDKDLGDIGGIPRLLDVGQCNDSYSAIQIAVALANAFDTDVNSLPLSMILSWYEQKACVILLTLLHLGIKNIRLGPSLPAFLTQDALNVLVEKFNIMPITTPEEDLKAILG